MDPFTAFERKFGGNVKSQGGKGGGTPANPFDAFEKHFSVARLNKKQEVSGLDRLNPDQRRSLGLAPVPTPAPVDTAKTLQGALQGVLGRATPTSATPAPQPTDYQRTHPTDFKNKINSGNDFNVGTHNNNVVNQSVIGGLTDIPKGVQKKVQSVASGVGRNLLDQILNAQHTAAPGTKDVTPQGQLNQEFYNKTGTTPQQYRPQNLAQQIAAAAPAASIPLQFVTGSILGSAAIGGVTSAASDFAQGKTKKDIAKGAASSAALGAGFAALGKGVNLIKEGSQLSHVTTADNLDSILSSGTLKRNAAKSSPGFESQNAVYAKKGVKTPDYTIAGEDNGKIVLKNGVTKGFDKIKEGDQVAIKSDVPINPKTVDRIEVSSQALADKYSAMGYKTVVNPDLNVPMPKGVKPNSIASDYTVPKPPKGQVLAKETGPIDSKLAKEIFDKQIVQKAPKEAGAVKSAGKELYRATVDSQAPLTGLSRQYEKLTGTKLDFASDPAKQAAIYRGVSGKVQSKLEELGQLVRQADDVKTLNEIGIARRTISDTSGLATPIPKEAAVTRLADLEKSLGPEKFKKYNDIVDGVIKKQDEMLQYMRDGGIISKESYSNIKASGQDYFSKYDVVDHLLTNESKFGKGDSFNVAKQDLVKARKGTEKAILNPIDATIKQWTKAVELVERNKVGNAIAKMTQDAPDLVSVLKTNEAPKAGFDKISTLIDGKKVDLAVDKVVADAYKGLTKQQADILTRWVGKPQASLLRAGATGLNVGFAITNAVRDFNNLALNSKNIPLYRLIPDYLSGFVSSVGRGVPGLKNVYKDFIEGGGAQSTFTSLTQKGINTSKDIVTKTRLERAGKTLVNPKEAFGIIRAIEEFNNTIELAPRLAEFKAAKRAGKSVAESAFDARGVTVDFSRGGTTTKLINQWVPFLNARVQGTDIMLKAIKDNPKRAIAYAGGLVALPTLYTYVNNRTHYSDILDQIPDYVKDNNFVLITSDKKDADGNPIGVIKIPKGDFGKAMGNAMETFLDHVYKQDPAGFAKISGQVLSDLSPIDFMRNGKVSPSQVVGSVTPPLAKGLVEGISNYSFFRENKLVSDKLSRLPNEQQTYQSTTGLAKTIGRIANQSPIKVDNFLQDTTGGLSRQLASPQNFKSSITGRVSGVYGNQVTTNAYNQFGSDSRLAKERNSISNKVTEAIKRNDLQEAMRIANEYNSKLDSQANQFNNRYNSPQEAKDLVDALRFKLNKRSISARKRQ